MEKNWLDKTYVITGGLGFIGSNVIKMLNDNGVNDIIILDKYNLKNNSFKNVVNLKYKDFYDADDFDFENYKLGDVIIHLGAETNTTNNDGNFIMENNYKYSQKLLQYSRLNNIKFIYASSASVYGSGNYGFVEDPLCEEPLNKYAFSKYLFDSYVRQIMNDVNFPIVGLRFFNVYGMQENHKKEMASYFYQKFKDIQEYNLNYITLFEDSENIYRDFVYIKDVIDVIKHFIQKEDIVNGIYNVGTGVARSFYDVADILTDLVPHQIYINEEPFSENLKNKYQFYTKANLTNLREVGGYTKEFTSLEDGLNEYYYFLKNYDGRYDKNMKIY